MGITNRDKLELYMRNADLFKIADEIIEKGEDVYSYVASKIFKKDCDECREFNKDMSWNPTGKMMRDIAKAICLNRMSIDELSEKYRLPYLSKLVEEAFPFIIPYDIEDGSAFNDEFSEERCLDATTFIVQLAGYVRFSGYCLENDRKLHDVVIKDIEESDTNDAYRITCGNSLIACQSADGKTLAEAINECNNVLKNKPELDFSDIEIME